MLGNSDPGWAFTDHCCRRCLGRVLERRGIYRCADCSVEASGTPNGICACGIQIVGSKIAAGFRCVRNPRRTPANPTDVVVMFCDDANQPGNLGATSS